MAAQRATLVAKRDTLDGKLETTLAKRDKAIADRRDLRTARDETAQATDDLAETSRQLTVLRDAVPGTFETAGADYLAQIDALGPTLERTFADTLNGGFRNIYLSTLVASLLAGLLLLLYPRRGRRPDMGQASDSHSSQ
jgi:hypothetical protein